MILSKKEFETLYNIESSYQTDPVRASNNTLKEIKFYENLFIKLEKLELIKIEYRDGKIYSTVTTPKGKKILKNKKYDKWII